LAKPNYQFEKRQKDLKRKQKQEEKRQRKLAARRGSKEGQEGQEGREQAPDESPGSAPSLDQGDTPPSGSQS